MIKNTFFLFSCFLFSFVLVAEEYATIKGSLKNASAELVWVDFVDSPFALETSSFGGEVQSDGSLTLQFKLKEPTVTQLHVGSQVAYIFIKPGSTITFEATAPDLKNTIKFSGDLASENNFLIAYSKNNPMTPVRSSASQKPMEYRKTADSNRSRMRSNLERGIRENGLDQGFIDFMFGKIDAEWAMRLFEYPFEYALRDFDADINKLNPEYYSFVDMVDVTNEAALHLPIYSEFLNEYILHKYRKNQKSNFLGDEDRYSKQYDFIQKILKNKPMSMALAKCLIDGFTYGKVENIRSKYEHFMATTSYEGYCVEVDDVFASASAFSAGVAAPKFNLEAADGRKVSLDSFNGKPLILDFWATWCGPCISEMKHSRRLQTMFGETDLQFVFISVDDDVNTWRTYLNRENMPGVHLNTPGLKSEMAQAYKLKGVPRYILIDRNGKIADSKAKSPSDEGLIDDLKGLLQN